MFRLSGKFLKWFAVFVFALIIIGLFACTDPPTENGSSNEVANLPVSLDKSWPVDEWPLSVDSGVLSCLDDGSVVFEHGNTKYAINGFATSRGYADIDPIWKAPEEVKIDGVVISAPKMSMILLDILLDFDLDLCGDTGTISVGLKSQ